MMDNKQAYHHQSQYSAQYNQPGYTTVVHQTVVSNSQTIKQRREWTAGLCDCCSDCGGLFCAYCFPCCYMYNLYKDAGEGFCDCFWGGLLPLRTKVRTERAIQGSICNDVFAVGCCPVCAMVQIGQELKATQPLI